MNNVFTKIIETMPKRISNDLSKFPYKNEDVFEMVLAAHNLYCEDEKDGTDYIFNINNSDDLKCLVNNGMTAKEVATIYNDSKINTSGFFFCDGTHDLEQITTCEEVRDLLIGMIDEICEYVLTYATRCKEYRTLYEKYVTDTYLEYKDAESLRDKTKFNLVCVKIGYDEGTDALAELRKKLSNLGY